MMEVRMRRIRRFLLAALILTALVPGAAKAGPDLSKTDPDLDRPLKWLVSAQNDNGGWGPEGKSEPDVATTAVSGISPIRLGHSIAQGPHQGRSEEHTAELQSQSK